MEEFHDIHQSTRLWLKSILVHGEQAKRITKKDKYMQDTMYAVELLLKVLAEMDGIPKNHHQDYVNFWWTARAYGKSLRVKWEEDAEALKTVMLDDEKFPLPIALKLEALIRVESFVEMDHHTCMTALKVHKYLRVAMEDKEEKERIISPLPRASPQPPISETNPLLEWVRNRLSITRSGEQLPELLGRPDDPFNFARLARR